MMRIGERKKPNLPKRNPLLLRKRIGILPKIPRKFLGMLTTKNGIKEK
jgi:hypothetical protein